MQCPPNVPNCKVKSVTFHTPIRCLSFVSHSNLFHFTHQIITLMTWQSSHCLNENNLDPKPTQETVPKGSQHMPPLQAGIITVNRHNNQYFEDKSLFVDEKQLRLNVRQSQSLEPVMPIRHQPSSAKQDPSTSR